MDTISISTNISQVSHIYDNYDIITNHTVAANVSKTNDMLRIDHWFNIAHAPISRKHYKLDKNDICIEINILYEGTLMNLASHVLDRGATSESLTDVISVPVTGMKYPDYCVNLDIKLCSIDSVKYIDSVQATVKLMTVAKWISRSSL